MVLKWMMAGLVLVCVLVTGRAEEPEEGNGRPAMLEMGELGDLEKLGEGRRRLVEVALAVGNESPWLKYVDGSADPAGGGFDCSGAMFFVMEKAGLKPLRSSAGQWEWLKTNGRLRLVPAEAEDAGDASLAELKPGDLLFWAVMEEDGVTKRIHHVAMYLGKEKKDGRAVMINSTDGRSYRGTKANGYGVYDFRVPKAESKSKLVGYGTPPGVEEGDGG